MLTLDLISGWPAMLAEADAWQDLLESCRDGVFGPDDTCSPLWARALASTHLHGADVGAIVVRRNGRVAVLVPYYVSTEGTFPLRRRELRQITEAHSGRASLLVRDDDPDAVAFLLESMLNGSLPWDMFVFGVVANSKTHGALTQAISRVRVPARCLAVRESPFVELGPSWDSVFNELPKKMRWTIRKSERDLREIGDLQYEELTAASTVDTLLGSIYEVERSSWKEKSGTSITAIEYQKRFYEAFVAMAAEGGTLSAHVLRLSKRPIAYILGVMDEGRIFLDHKESFDLRFAEHSPGHVLKRFAIERLIFRGIAVLDLMGACEPYKMRWTSKTYRRFTVGIYNQTLRGRIQFARARVAGNSYVFN